jgi:hypothetical protein
MGPTLTIDGNNFSDFEGFVREFNPAVFGDDRTWTGGFGMLNDLLRAGYGTPEGAFTIEWRHSHKSRKDLGKEASLAWLELRNERVHPTARDLWAKRIALMQHDSGDTLFHKIVDIIVSHENITLILA